MITTFRAHHISLTVVDIERSVAFYRLFGFLSSHSYVSEDPAYLISHLLLGNLTLELFQFPLAKAESALSNRDVRPIGLRHFALEVDSIHEAHRQVAEMGFECETPTIGISGLRYFFVRDPDGNSETGIQVSEVGQGHVSAAAIEQLIVAYQMQGPVR